MKIIISTGQGRLHLMQSAYWLAKRGLSVKILVGWMPKNCNCLLVQLASRIVGRDLSAGFVKRCQGGDGCEVVSSAWPEFVDHLLRIVCTKFLHCTTRYVAAFSWTLLGLNSRRYLRNADIFHVRSGAGHGGAIKAAKKRGMRVLVDHSIAHPKYMGEYLKDDFLRNGVEFTYELSNPFWRMVIEDCLFADLLMVNSYFVRDTFIEAGFDPEKIRVVYLGVRPDFFALRKHTCETQNKVKILFTGNFGFRKGAEYFMEIIKCLGDVVGDCFEVDVYGAYIDSLPLMSRYKQYALPIFFHGPVPQDELKKCLSESDIYLFPSLAEGCASSGMEALAAGLCVVTTKESGLPITDGENGFVLPKKDVNAFVEKMRFLISNPKVIDSIGLKAAQLIQNHYTWDQYAQKTEAIYRELIGK